MTAGRPAATSAHGWRIATLHGVPVYIGRSWPVIALIIVVTYGPRIPNLNVGGEGGTFGYAVAVAYALLLLLSVLVHEGAHAVAAARFGYRVDRVVADLWGGHTVYDSSASRPGASAAIAVVGPVANLALGGVGYLLQGTYDTGVVGLLLGAVTWTNLFVGAFNLLPGLPLDGGFIVDALVWKATGDRNKGLIAAGWLGRILTVVVVLWVVARPLLAGESPDIFTIVWCGLIGAFLWAGATSAIRSGTSRRVIAGVSLAQVTRPVVVVSTTDPVSRVLALTGAGGPVAAADAGVVPVGTVADPTVVAVEPSGNPLGLVDLRTLRSLDPTRQDQVTVAALVARQPDGWVIVAERDADVSGVISAIVSRPQLQEGLDGIRLVLVVTPAGEVLGTVSTTDLNAAFGG